MYPSKPKVRKDLGPEPLSVMGNEGVATVEGFVEDGEVEHKLKVGDRGASYSLLSTLYKCAKLTLEPACSCHGRAATRSVSRASPFERSTTSR